MPIIIAGCRSSCALFSSDIDLAPEGLPDGALEPYGELKAAIDAMKGAATQRVKEELLSPPERKLYSHPDAEASGEYNYSALETLVNVAVHEGIVNESRTRGVFIPRQYQT